MFNLKMKTNQNIIKKKIDKLISIIKKGNLNKALKEAENLSSNYKNIPLIFNLYGIVQLKLNQFESSVKTFDKAIQLDPKYVEAYNNLGNAMMELGKFEDAINIYKKALNLKPEYASGYNNLASALDDLGKYEEAIFNYSKAIEFNPDFNIAKENIIKVLTFHNPKNTNLNIFTKSNNLLQNIQIPYGTEEEISDEEVISFYKKCNEISADNFKNLKFNLSQIWRSNTIDLGCIRHFKVFNTFKVIPEYCFGCFKVQVELSSITDLFKLYFIFDNLKLPQNNSRKCMVELRSIAGGSYKGLIYCFGYDDANQIYKKLNDIIVKKIKRKVQLKIKRGCTEFGIEHPNFEEINKKSEKFMKYKNEWREKEKIIDNQTPEVIRQNQRKLSDTISGVTLKDVLIMKNWIMYAKKIEDMDYKKFDEDIPFSNHIEMEFSNQLDHRIKEHSKIK
tara:strand:+ start:750 stop:2093 length:1344 start_codon:yes stop_codon:yes gene_type:complete